MDVKALLEEFKTYLDSDSTLASISQKLASGNYSRTDSFKYSQRSGKLFESFLENKGISLGDFSGQELSDFIENYVSQAYKYLQQQNINYASNMQQAQNAANGLSLRAVDVKPNSERVSNLCDRLLEDPENSEFLLEAPAAENIARDAVTETIDENAAFQKEAGLTVYITRSTGGGCCDWCEGMSGTFEYGKQPDDFFLAHRNCSCTWVTHTARGERTRMSFKTENGKLKKK